MRYFFDLICHYLTSNSRHGTHSPFVYKMADEVIYKKKEDKVIIEEGHGAVCLINEIQEYYKPARCIHLVDASAYSLSEIILLQKKYDFIFLSDIYKRREDKKKWSAIVADPNIVVTIDLFYFGVIISRKGQVKENFKLRFPYSKY